MFKPMNITVQQQPLLVSSNIPSNRILDKVDQHLKHQSTTSTQADLNNHNDDSINIFNNDKTEFPEILFEDLMDLQDEYRMLLMSQQNLNSTHSNQLDMFTSSHHVIQTNSSLPEPRTIDSAILPQEIIQEPYQYINTSQSNSMEVHQNQLTTGGPTNYISDSSKCTPCPTKQIQNDYTYQQQQLFQYDVLKSKKIQIKSQPRSKFRPRTQNESKTSAHYLRCEGGDELDYPAILVPQAWAYQSDLNIIEVSLMGIDKEEHPYTIKSKTSTDALKDCALIFKQNKPNVLYFLLTNDDFLSGYRTFMIEFVKSKQDDIITKKLIRERKLDQSMLRFTRIYRDDHQNYQRDVDSEEYSSVMTETYGDVAVEQMGPRYGPMNGQEMFFITFKGRISKDDVSIIVSEQRTRWSQELKAFSINGNVVFFPMPAFPYTQTNRVIANVSIYFKKQRLHQSNYLYMNLLDHELAEINLHDLTSLDTTSETSEDFNHDILIDSHPTPITSSKTSKNKSTKRLSSK